MVDTIIKTVTNDTDIYVFLLYFFILPAERINEETKKALTERKTLLKKVVKAKPVVFKIKEILFAI